jgi:uncharacterized protein
VIWNRLTRLVRSRRPGPLLVSRADVVTDAPERYARQLASHLGHRITISPTPDGDVYAFDGGRGVVRAGDGVLALTAQGHGDEALGVVQDVLGRHLLRFGAKAGLEVTWSPAAPGVQIPVNRPDH